MTKSKNNGNKGKQNKVKGNFPNLKNDVPIKVEKAYRIPNKLDQKRNSPWNIITKNLNVQIKKRY